MPFSGGQPIGGVEQGPDLLRKEGQLAKMYAFGYVHTNITVPFILSFGFSFSHSLSGLGWGVTDTGNVEIPTSRNEPEVWHRVKNPR